MLVNERRLMYMKRNDLEEVVIKCEESYEEDWCDMDVIQPEDHEDYIEDFRHYLKKEKKEIFKKCVQKIVHDGEQVQYYSIFDLLVVMEEMGMSYEETLQIFLDYCMYNVTFGEAVYSTGKSWLESLDE